jgi:mutator protein MutT
MKPLALRLAGCILRNDAGDILLLHRNKKGVQQWELPGGKLERDEEGEAAAIREIREELGVEVRIVAFLGQADFQENDRRCCYEWYEAELVATLASPRICEPQTFDDLRYWNAESLKDRPDVSANLQNLLKSGVV